MQPGDQSVQWMDGLLFYFFTGFFFCSGFVLVGFAAVLSLVWTKRELLCASLYRMRIGFKAVILKEITDTLRQKMYVVAHEID